MRICLFGGTFDPVHIGHKKVIQHIIQTLPFDKILVIPNSIPPHKNRIQASFEHRLNMVSLAFEGVKGIEIDEEKIKDTKSLLALDNDNNSQPDLFIQTKKRKIIPRSINQKKYLKSLDNKDVIFAIGPAGTGKTFLATVLAVRMLHERKVERLVLTRPAVEAGERLGFLPGDLQQKVDPQSQVEIFSPRRDLFPHACDNHLM